MSAVPPISVSSPLGDDAFFLHDMQATEALCRPFRYELDLYSEDGAIDPDALLGESMTVKLALPEGGERYFNGLVSRFEQVGFAGAGYAGGYARYKAVLVPAIWFLNRTADCRIFQEVSAKDIIKEIFRKHDFLIFDEALYGKYRSRVYCVQYRETDADFVHRLMEEEGMYYYFEHEDGQHTLVLADAITSHSPTANYEKIEFYPEAERVGPERECITTWQITREVQSGKYAYKDYDFEKPKKDLLKAKDVSRSHALAALEYYDYPGHYIEPDDGENYARVRIEELHAQFEVMEGDGNARGVCVGGLFDLEKHPRQDQNREYLIVSAEHRLHTEAPFEDTHGADNSDLYACRLAVIASDTPYRPPCLTPKPLVKGPQTATIVGKAGEEIWTDKHGRVKVQFHWDRYGKFDESSSCWVRVSYPWAGPGWGAVAVPRIGQEVVIDFLEGNPDEPLVTGRVYNGDNKPPFGLPGGAVISGVKSNSTKGGGGYNEYVLDDTAGAELIREHGQFDKDSTIEHDLREHVLNDRSRDVGNDETLQIGNNRTDTVGTDETTSIGNNRTETVGTDETISIGNNRTETVGTNESITVGANRTRSVGSNESITVALARTHTVGVNEMINVGAAQEVTIGGLQAVTVGVTRALTVGTSQTASFGTSLSESVGTNRSETVGGNKSEGVKGNSSESVDGNKSLQVKKDLTEGVDGKHSETVKKDYSLKAKKVTVEADDEITLKTGSATIQMKSNGNIVIDGAKISVKGSGDVVIEGSNILQN